MRSRRCRSRAGVARPRPAATPLLADLFDVLDRQEAAVATLQTELARTADPMAALAVQRRIEKVKQDAEVELLRVQATHARRGRGRARRAARRRDRRAHRASRRERTGRAPRPDARRSPLSPGRTTIMRKHLSALALLCLSCAAVPTARARTCTAPRPVPPDRAVTRDGAHVRSTVEVRALKGAA
ncbi:MAG: hypothetical protein IPJ04_06950 [Candidatus Eisenbacteria bacterium]|nr:hypothetical protein [Candidatus Eisenbacteria bacterium]